MSSWESADQCGDYDNCPKICIDGESALVQGAGVTDEQVLARMRPGQGEQVVALPLDVLRALVREVTGMDVWRQ